MKEVLCIRLTPEDTRFNRDGGYKLPDHYLANAHVHFQLLTGASRSINFIPS